MHEQGNPSRIDSGEPRFTVETPDGETPFAAFADADRAAVDYLYKVDPDAVVVVAYPDGFRQPYALSENARESL